MDSVALDLLLCELLSEIQLRKAGVKVWHGAYVAVVLIYMRLHLYQWIMPTFLHCPSDLRKADTKVGCRRKKGGWRGKGRHGCEKYVEKLEWMEVVDFLSQSQRHKYTHTLHYSLKPRPFSWSRCRSRSHTPPPHSLTQIQQQPLSPQINTGLTFSGESATFPVCSAPQTYSPMSVSALSGQQRRTDWSGWLCFGPESCFLAAWRGASGRGSLAEEDGGLLPLLFAMPALPLGLHLAGRPLPAGPQQQHGGPREHGCGARGGDTDYFRGDPRAVAPEASRAALPGAVRLRGAQWRRAVSARRRQTVRNREARGVRAREEADGQPRVRTHPRQLCGSAAGRVRQTQVSVRERTTTAPYSGPY